MPNEPAKHFVERFDTRSFIAISLTLSMIALTFFLASRIPESDAFKILLGAMLTVGFASAIGWYFNSSSGSEKKDTTQAKVAEELAKKVTSRNPSLEDAERVAVAAAAAAAPAAAAVAAPAAAAVAAPPAAELAAPPVVAKEVPPAVEKAVEQAMAAREEVDKQQDSKPN